MKLVADGVWVQAGVTWVILAEFLTKQGLALETVPALGHLNVVGSIVTGSHGTRALAGMVSAIEYVDC